MDANQSAVVAGLRRVGCSVAILSDLGDGIPDLLVGVRGQTFLLEVKDGNAPPSERKLTPDQQVFRDTWRGGPLITVESVDDAVRIVALTKVIT